MPPVIAFDIETCPLPADALGPRARRRLDLLVERERRRAERDGTPFDPAEASRRAQSLHGALGWVCCVSFARLGADGAPRTPHSFSAAEPGQERALLTRLWATVARLPRTVLWVSFHGKGFDAEFLATRSAAHGLAPSRRDLLHRHPYVHHPHLDLAGLWRRTDMGLDDACELLGVASPKTPARATGGGDAAGSTGGAPTRDSSAGDALAGDAVVLDGSGVAQAVADGRLSEVVAYCERDAVATLRAYCALAPLL